MDVKDLGKQDKPYTYQAFPAMMYQPDGRSMQVATQEAKDLAVKDGWADKPFAKAASPVGPSAIEKIAELEKRIAVLEQNFCALTGTVTQPVEKRGPGRPPKQVDDGA